MLFDSSAIPTDVLGIMGSLSRSGFDAWLVGGALRDIMLGLPPRDWDLGTNATPQEVMAIFPKVIPIGIRHGTVQVHTSQRHVEVTTFEGSGGEGILRDLERRDFTVNAFAYCCRTGELLDPHHGLSDLKKGLLRAVGDARSRFEEDPLRTLRAGRLVSVYGFKIHRATFLALKGVSGDLDLVAKERVREELFKMILGKNIVDALEWMRKGGVLQKIIPDLVQGNKRAKELECYRHSVLVVHHSPPCLRVRLAALFHDLAGPGLRQRKSGGRPHSPAEASSLVAEEIMRNLRMSHRLIQEVLVLIRNQVPREPEALSDAQVRRFIAQVGPELINDVLDLAYADRVAEKGSTVPIKTLDILRARVSVQLDRKMPLGTKDLAVDGLDVMRIKGLAPGPDVGRILLRLYHEILEKPHLNERKILIDFLRRMPY